MTERTFDRIPQFDARSRSFPIREKVGDKPQRSYTWRCPVRLDQGFEGACVGFAFAHEIAARPKERADINEADAFDIYRQAKVVDEWAGEAYDGTSVLAGAKVLTGAEWFDSYRWAFSLNDLILAVGYTGPAVLGINWHEGMLNPDKHGYLRPTGDIVGGHAILTNAVQVRQHDFRVVNSWGPGWGLNGTARIHFDDMEQLLHEQGEACIPIRRLK